MSDLHHELQRHAGGLRDLARDLLRDAHAAEDVTQAAMQQALVQRDLQPGPLGGWLHRTVVNFARQWRRSARRREAREAALPVREPVPAVAEQLARREMLQRVTDAVLRLDEPYQTAVFLRYFEDLPPRAIARRTGANLATVKSRLARGLVLLRSRLDHPATSRGRDWRAGLAATFGLPMLDPVWPVPTGTLIVSSTTKVLFVAGAACVGGLLFLQFRDPPAPVAPGTIQGENKLTVGAVNASLENAEPKTARTEVPASATDASWLEHPYEVGLDVLVVDSLGLPIEGHKLDLAPFGCAKNEAEQATGPDGRVAVTWRTRVPSIEVQIADPRGQTRRLTLQSGHRTAITLLGRRQQGGVRFSIGTKGGVQVANVIQIDSSSLTLNANEVRFADSNAEPDLRMHLGLHPAAVFGDPLAFVSPKSEQEAAGPSLSFTFGEGALEVSGLAVERVMSRRTKTEDAPTNSIAGTAFGADGKPAAKVPVVLLGSGPQPLQRTEADDQGRFRFQNVPPGEFTVRAGGDQQGLATVPAIVTSGDTPVTVQLQRGACIRGRATNSAGKPRGEHLVEWRALDGSWCDAVRTGKDGTFTFANLPAGPGALSLFAPQDNRSIPIATIASILPDTGEAVLSAPEDKGSVLHLEPPPLLPGQPAPKLIAWHSDSGLAVAFQAPEKGTVWSSPKLPAGFYDLEMRTPGVGTRPLGRHWLDGEHDADLGRVDGAQGGTIRIAIPASSLPADKDKQALEICVLRKDVDIRVEPTALPLDTAIALPVGDYVLAFRHADGGTRFHRFAVAAGKETVVTPAP